MSGGDSEVRSSRSASIRGRIAVLATVAIAACSSAATNACLEVPLAPGVERERVEAVVALDFEPTAVCGYRSDLEVRRVFLDTAFEEEPQPRVNSIVEREGERAFLFSETRAVVPFRAIPQGTRRLDVSSGGVTASGFAGPSGGGEEIAYLRWRAGGVTSELAVTLRPWLDESDVEALASALIEAGTARPTSE